MKLTQIATAIKEAGKPLDCWNLLIYGDPKTGKTRLAATIAKVPHIKNVHFFTVENGTETLLTMLRENVLTQEQAEKIIVYDIPDTPAHPYAFETISKIITTDRNWIICEKHGRCDCQDCAVRGPDKIISGAKSKGSILSYEGQPFNLAKLTKEAVVIIDNLTQVSRSTLAWKMFGKDYDIKAGWDEYGPQGRVLSDILSVMQACASTNFIATSHRVGIDFKNTGQRADPDEAQDDDVTTKYYPAIGTKNFSLLCGGFFSHIVYVEMKLNQHKGGSATNYNQDILTGSRGGWRLEKEKEMDLSLLFHHLVSSSK